MTTAPEPKRRGRPRTEAGTTPPAERKARSRAALEAAGGRELNRIRLETAADVDNLALLRSLLPGCKDAGAVVRAALLTAAQHWAQDLTPEMRAKEIAAGRTALWGE
jgi:hypothetical protein